jgi:mono/diheme cytochrome c family protein
MNILRFSRPRQGATVACALLLTCTLAFAAADGKWLTKVSPEDHARTNPLAGQPQAIAAGANLYSQHCARCHGAEAQGKGSRPALVSDRIRAASDGDLAWILKNGVPFHGMPGWAGLPEQERWQLVAYIRSLNNNPAAATGSTAR